MWRDNLNLNGRELWIRFLLFNEQRIPPRGQRVHAGMIKSNVLYSYTYK